MVNFKFLLWSVCMGCERRWVGSCCTVLVFHVQCTVVMILGGGV
jgi:hypothetical protein